MINTEKNGLYTDYYELTMAQGYFLQERHNQQATFDYFYRKNPFHGGYVIFSGLSEFLNQLEKFEYGKQELDYLHKQGFNEKFLSYLSDFRFCGDIYSFREGDVAFPLEPIVRVSGNVVETQLIESMLLNILNFSSLISTKAIRIRHEAGDRLFVDFGLRRAQGLGSMHASRAAIIGGADSSSHVLAGSEYDIPVSGTMAHSWIQSFDTELQAFRAFAEIYPDDCVLLIDTYDTLNSGLENALIIAEELEMKGHKLKGIRLDSGDLAYLSKKVRKRLDSDGFNYVSITASNQLDEYLIRSLNLQNAPLDVFGVGTSLITGAKDAALDGVYKMSEFNNIPRLKVSEDITKLSFPGKKNVLRFYDSENYFYADAVILEEEDKIEKIIHPHHKQKQCDPGNLKSERLLKPVMEDGKRVEKAVPVNQIAAYTKKRISHIDESVLRLENPHIYKVGLSEKLMELRDNIVFDIQKNGG
ncbi:MAG: nicotinate phosphoribosyltransferase [Bacteroidales bacterium]|nr:nicotinate phosphoribosyltransferase [Bacteroidales bacterium]